MTNPIMRWHKLSTSIYSNGEINSRLNLLVEQKSKGNVSDFAKLIGINIQTLHTYIKGRMPSAEALFNICIKLQVNINWLLTGNGPIYIYGEEEGGAPEADDPEVADLIEGARRVLKSGNVVAFDALERNIRYFDFAIQQEQRMAEMEKRLAALEEKGGGEKPSGEAPSSHKKVA